MRENIDNMAMIVSGWNIFDGLCRVIETYHPITENLGSETTINRWRNEIAPTRTTFDTRDRPLTVTLPDGAITQTTYEIGDIGNELGFITTQIDPLGRVSKSPAGADL